MRRLVKLWEAMTEHATPTAVIGAAAADGSLRTRMVGEAETVISAINGVCGKSLASAVCLDLGSQARHRACFRGAIYLLPFKADTR